MKISGLHMLLTYQCTLECEHCFVWGSPWQEGTMTMNSIRLALEQARETGTVEWIYFEGGEPFLYYALLLSAVREVTSMGFKVGIVSNSYWANDLNDAIRWLEPMAGLVQDLSISSDHYHWSEVYGRRTENARQAAQALGIPVGMISVAQPEAAEVPLANGQLPEDESRVMYRGRAASKLAGRMVGRTWESFDTCPCEDLRDPGRVHLDFLGNVLICQGISIGNIFETRLAEICERYDPDAHPITHPLLAGGPAELARRYGLVPQETYADACHLCYESRRVLRERFPETLGPNQVYGIYQD